MHQVAHSQQTKLDGLCLHVDIPFHDLKFQGELAKSTQNRLCCHGPGQTNSKATVWLFLLFIMEAS